MDPVTAIGLVSGVLTFLTFGTAVVKGAVEIHQSTSGILEGIRTSEDAARELKRLAARLRPPHSSDFSGNDDLSVLADECHLLAEKLVEMLESLKPGDRNSKRQSLWASLKNKLHENERKDLEEQLKGFRDRLHLQLTVVTKSSVQELADLVKANAVKTEDLQQSIRQLKEGIEIAGLSDLAKSQVKTLLTFPDNITILITQHRILSALAFPDMHGRHDSIERAHADTFRWLMHHDTTDEEAIAKKLWWLDSNEALAEAKKRKEAHKRFTGWLESGDGIFHISGKLGSGKSTLMKYLGDEAKSSNCLRAWIGDRKLVFAQFYFWRNGPEPRQRSLDGLRRTLLHEVLRQCPELIYPVLPSLWDEIKSIPWQVLLPSAHISQDEIEDAFARLVNSIGRGRYRELCFCFFIDGLDEYEPRGRSDYTSMANLLNEWATNGSPSHGIKLCVSSRNYNAFQNAFQETRRLYLHELTYMDMQTVVRDDLKDISHSPGFSVLIDYILHTAQGIFQWVTVVVRYLRDQIANGVDKADELKAEVEKLPAGIYELYSEVLKRLPDTTTQRRAYRTLAMVAKANELDICFSVGAYCFFRNYEADKEFITRDTFPEIVSSGSKQREELGIKLLRGCSGGLVEPFLIPNPWLLYKGNMVQAIRFTHRSVADFLTSKDVQKETREHLEDFSSLDAVSQMFLADLHISSGIGPTNIDVILVSQLLHLRYNASLEERPYNFLEALDKLVCSEDDISPSFLNSEALGTAEGESVETRGWVQQAVRIPNRPSYTSSYTPLVRPVYFSISKGSSEYCLWKMHKDPSITNNAEKVALLAYIVFKRRRMNRWQDEMADFAILEFLHTRNLFTETTRLAPTATSPAHADEAARHALDACGQTTPRLTAWHHFLQFEWKYQHQGMPSGNYDHSRSLTYEQLDTGFAKTVVWFLQRGADPTFATKSSFFGVETIGSADNTSPIEGRIILSVDFFFKGRMAGGAVTEFQVVNDTLWIRQGQNARRNLFHCRSLREWILDLKADDQTKKEILQLLPETPSLTKIHKTAGGLWRRSFTRLSDFPKYFDSTWLTTLALFPLFVLLAVYFFGWGMVLGG